MTLGQNGAKNHTDETSDDKVFLEQAKALLPIYPVLWRHFKFPELIGNPTNSPFRTDTDPSFATEDKMACEYDFTISHRSLVDPETKVSKIRFVSDSGKSLVLEGWRRNMTFVQPHPMDQNRPSPKTGERIPNSPQEGPSRTPQIISLRLVGRNTVSKRARTTQKNLVIRHAAAAIWLGCFRRRICNRSWSV
jgi:hypothetical protein